VSLQVFVGQRGDAQRGSPTLDLMAAHGSRSPSTRLSVPGLTVWPMAVTECDHVDSADARPWPDEWDEVVVGLLATGVMKLSEQISAGTSIEVPYGVPLQRALDRVTAMSLAADVTAPRSVMDLLDWARQPFQDWPLRLEVDGVDAGECLLAGGRPTRACLEWAILGSGDVEAEIRENRLMNTVLDKCRAHNRPDVYTAFRQLLVERPALSERALAEIIGRTERPGNPAMAFVASEIRAAYRPAPAEALAGGFAEVCRGCGNLRVIDAHGRRICQEWDCPNPLSPRERITEAEGALWLRREVRMFVTAPGRAELRIAHAIERRLGSEKVTVALWPDYDSCDVLPDGLAWPADVKSWANPVRLARRLNEHPFRPPPGAERAFIVIAQEQTAGRPHYIRTVHRHCDWLKRSRHVRVVTEQNYINGVVKQIRGRSR
jgi:restriction endonuclease in pPIWI_RE module